MTYPDRSNLDFDEVSRNKKLARNLYARTLRLRANVLELAANPTAFGNLGYIEPDEIGVLSVAEINGNSEVSVCFGHSLSGWKSNYRKVDVKTPDTVSVNLYTDRATFDQVQKLYAYDWEERVGMSLEEVKEQLADVFTADEVDNMTFRGAVLGDDLFTYYFTDQEGNFAKVIGMPTEIAGDRKDLLIAGHPIKDTVSVQVPMTARDFVLLGTCLDVLTQDVDKARRTFR